MVIGDPNSPPRKTFELSLFSQKSASSSFDFSHIVPARPVDRLAAFLIDITVVLVPAFFLLGSSFRKLMTAGFILSEGSEVFFGLMGLSFTALVLFISYFSFFHWWFGATPGKYIFDLRVKAIDPNQKISLFDAFTRSAFVVCEMAFGFWPLLSIFSHPLRRAFHDRVTDVVVVGIKSTSLARPMPWESALAKAGRAFSLGIVAVLVLSQARRLNEPLKELSQASLGSDSHGCENIDSEVDEDDRLKQAMTLYAAGEVDRDCLASELDLRLQNKKPNDSLAYLAQAFVNAEDADVSNAYLDQVCTDQPGSAECTMSQVVGYWSDGNWEKVEETLKQAQPAPPYLSVWAVRHFMKRAQYTQALHFLDQLLDEHEVSGFLQVARVKSLFGIGQKEHASVAMLQVLPSLPKVESKNLKSWVCLNRLQDSCLQSVVELCDSGRSSDEGDLVQVLIDECRGDASVDYLALADGSSSQGMRDLMTASHKIKKGDRESAFRLLLSLTQDEDQEESVRSEAFRRILNLQDTRFLDLAMASWEQFEDRPLWLRAGQMLMSHLTESRDLPRALIVAQHLMPEVPLDKEALAFLSGLDSELSTRSPASRRRDGR